MIEITEEEFQTIYQALEAATSGDFTVEGLEETMTLEDRAWEAAQAVKSRTDAGTTDLPE